MPRTKEQPEIPTVGTYAARYLQRIRDTGQPKTYKRYYHALNNFLDAFRDRDHRYPQQFHRYDIADYRDVRLRSGAKPSTVKLELAIVSAFWQYLIEREVVEVNPAAGQTHLRTDETPRRALTLDTVARLLASAHSSVDKLLVLLPVTTGMRGNELSQLRWTDLDFEAGLVHLTGERCKTHRSRVLPLRQDVLQLLQARRDEAGEDPMVFGVQPEALRYRYRRLTVRAGVAYTGLHSLRHTFATVMLRKGVDVNTVRQLLGHSNLTTTMIYLKAAPAELVRSQLDVFPSA